MPQRFSNPSAQPGASHRRPHHPAPAAPPAFAASPTLTLLTWDEYKAFNVSSSSSNHLGLSGDDALMDTFGDDSDEDDFASGMSDDDMIPASLWKATCVPAFTVDAFDYSSSSAESSPAMPSASLHECINTPTFALVSTHAHSMWRSSTQQPSAPTPVHTWKAAPSPGRKSRSPKAQPHRRKRKTKGASAATPNDELNAAVKTLTGVSAVKQQPRSAASKKKTRHPLQPKVPNAAVNNEVMRSVTA